MKNNTALILALFVLLTTCEKQENDFPNMEISNVIQDIQLYDNYNNIKQFLVDKYHLQFDRKIEQKEKNKNVYVFSGGKINNIKTKSWTVIFENDSLNSFVITIESVSENKTFEDLAKLKEKINSLSIIKYYGQDEFWIINDVKERKYGIQLKSNSRTILILFSSEKYINKYLSI